MAQSRDRRRIDWRIIMEGKLPAARLSNPTLPVKQLASLISDAVSDPDPGTPDRIIRHAVDFAKSTLLLERTAVYLLDEENFLMTGTWGSNAQGETIDEHTLIYDYGPIDREVFARAQAGFPWTVYEDCPHITQDGDQTRVIGSGWVACTAIMGPTGPIGVLFNDTAISHDPLDESKQWRAAILCSILGNALWRLKSATVQQTAEGPAAQPEIVRKVARLLTQDPTLTCDALARELHMSPRGLARSFKKEAKSSIVDYRNELRLASFLERAGAHPGNLLQAALEAGFGSYAQFHRVFRARFGRAPSDYLLEKSPSSAPAAQHAVSVELEVPDSDTPRH